MDNENQRIDFEWFLSKREDFFKQYGHCFLVIKDKNVIGRFDSFSNAVKNMDGREPAGSFIIQECTDNPDGNTNTVVTVGLHVI